jgi:hypothetical protein
MMAWKAKMLPVCRCMAVVLVMALEASPQAWAEPPGRAPDHAAELRHIAEDVRWLTAHPSRLAGTDGHAAVHRRLHECVRQLTGRGVLLWSQGFSVVVPHVRRSNGQALADLTVPEGPLQGRHRVHPFWPCSVRLNTTPAEGITGRMVYVGHGRPWEVPPKSIRGQIAVMELAAGGRWRRVFHAGPRAMLLLADGSEVHRQVREHLRRVPLNCPRFFVPPGRLADALREERIPVATVRCSAEWREVTATNLYALVPAREGERSRRALTIAVRYDSMSLVPDVAPGANSAVNTATALELLRHFAAHRPRQPVLFAFIDAFGINHLGMRQMLLALSPGDRERRATLEEDRELVEDTYAPAAELMSELLACDNPVHSASRPRYADLHEYIKDEVNREVVRLEEQLAPKRLARLDAMGERLRTLEADIRRLADVRRSFLAAETLLLNAIGGGQEAVRRRAAALLRRVAERVYGQLAEAKGRLAARAARDRIRRQMLEALSLAPGKATPITFLLGLELSDAGIHAGPVPYCYQFGNEEAGNARELWTWLRNLSDQQRSALWPGRLRRAVNLRPLLGQDSSASFLPVRKACFTSTARSFGVPAMTWGTLNAPAGKADTPNDTPERLRWERLGPQVAATMAMIRGLANDGGFSGRPKPTRWARVRGVIVDRGPGEPLPRVPMYRYLATLIPGKAAPGKVNLHGHDGTFPEVRRRQFVHTGMDGQFHVDALPVMVGIGGKDHWEAMREQQMTVQAYSLAEDGRIVRSVDLGRAGRAIKVNVDISDESRSPLRAVVFTCEELSLPHLHDPRFLSGLSGIVYEARRGGKPRRVYLCNKGNDLSAQLEPGVRWQVVLRAGVTRNRLAMVNMSELEAVRREGLSTREAMRGFGLSRPLPGHPVHVGATDLYRLDAKRLADYSRAGIHSRAIARVHARTAKLLAEADDALVADDGAAYFASVYGAAANEVRAYQAVRDTGNDVVRGAVFLLLMLIPFSFAMDRLLFASPIIYRQIAGMMAIFAVMAGLLWSFHPAFRISSQPLMIVMAFAIIAMSVLVLAVVYQKFRGGLAEFRSGRAEGSGASTTGLGLLGTAVRLGIANMRKRKVRTFLTGTTVVVITFSLLCFMSTSTYVGHTELSVDAEAQYTGVLVRLSTSANLPSFAVDYLETIFPADRVAPRWWWAHAEKERWCIHLTNAQTGRQLRVAAALGLSANERHLGDLAGGDKPILPRWNRFVDKGGCYLAAEAAERLGVSPGEKVAMAGMEMELIGTFDRRRLESRIDLNGMSLLPIHFELLPEKKRKYVKWQGVDTLVQEMAGGGGLEAATDLPHVPGDDLIIAPIENLRGLHESRLRGIAIAARDHAEARSIAYRLADRLAYPLYYSAPDGVKAVLTTPLLPRAPRSLVIPLVIGALIIFNTMLSSIAERRRDIYVYTSLGLAPLHIGVLFLAEAATYGLMGSIFGYIAGQGLATLMTHLGWMGGITLNYSGTQAVTVMGCVLAVVILSSLVPAYRGGRLAAPSNVRTWRVPEPEGDVIRDSLPFTVTPAAAPGMIHFMWEYLDAHREGSIGHCTVSDLRAETLPSDGVELPGLTMTAWLAPYDLGVRQEVRIRTCLTDDADVLALAVELVRGAGQTRTWWKLNRPFLGDLRRQLLGWRNLKPQRVLRHIEAGHALLEKSKAHARRP